MFQELELNEIVLPAGFLSRPASIDDVAAVVAIDHANEMELLGRLQTSLEETRAEWLEEGFDIAHSVRVVENEAGEIVAHALLWDGMPNPVAVWFFCGVHPAYRGQGLATALHQWGQVRAREVFGRVEPDVQVVMGVSALSEHEQAHALFQNLGYQHTRFYWRMGIDLPEVLPEVAVPAGIVIKNWTELGETVSLREIVEAKEDSFRDHWGFYEAPLDEVVERWANLHKTDPFFDPSTYFVALDTTQNNAIAGVSLCYLPSETKPGCGYVGTLGVRRPWRRTGLGLALLQHSFHTFQQKGYSRMELHVDGSSLTGATRLYEKAGMAIVERSDRYEMVLRPGRDVMKKE